MPAVAISMPLLSSAAADPHGAALDRKQAHQFSPSCAEASSAFVLVAVVTYFIGAPLLTLVYSTDNPLPELMVLVLIGALNADRRHPLLCTDHASPACSPSWRS